jgi:hypothetical protein
VVQNLPDAPPSEPGLTVVRPGELSAEQLALSFVVPLFGPANRATAWKEAKALGARRFEPLIDPTAVVPTRLALAEGIYVNAGVVIGATRVSAASPSSIAARGSATMSCSTTSYRSGRAPISAARSGSAAAPRSATVR